MGQAARSTRVPAATTAATSSPATPRAASSSSSTAPRRLVFTWGWEPGEDGPNPLPPGSSTIEIELDARRRRHEAALHAPRPAERRRRRVARPRLGSLPRAARDRGRRRRPRRRSLADRRHEVRGMREAGATRARLRESVQTAVRCRPSDLLTCLTCSSASRSWSRFSSSRCTISVSPSDSARSIIPS